MKENGSYAKDILNRPPNWLVRWGVTTIFISSLSVLAVLCLLKYPDTTRVRVTLYTSTPPLDICTRQSGTILQLYIKDQQIVNIGDKICLIEGPFDVNDVLKLEAFIKKFREIKEPHNFNELDFPKIDSLGYLSQLISSTTYLYDDLLYFMNDSTYIMRIKYLEAEKIRIKQLIAILTQQMSILSQKEEVLRVKYNLSKSLFYENDTLNEFVLLGKLEYFNIVDKKHDLQTEVYHFNSSLSKLDNVTDSLRHSIKIGIQRYRYRLNRIFDSIEDEIQNWRNQYLVVATTRGRISFIPGFDVDTYVDNSTPIAVIVPEFSNENRIVGMGKVLTNELWKIEIGSNAKLYLDDYSDFRFGHINCKVTNISKLSLTDTPTQIEDNNLELGLGLPLITSTDEVLIYKAGMMGTAEFISNNLSVLERLKVKVRSIIGN